MLRAAFGLTVGLLLMDPDVEKGRIKEEFGDKPLSEWSRTDWERCKEGLVEFVEVILEQGAVVGINDPNDETLCFERVESKIYNIKRIAAGLDACTILAPLRLAIKDQFADHRRRAMPELSRDVLVNFR